MEAPLQEEDDQDAFFCPYGTATLTAPGADSSWEQQQSNILFLLSFFWILFSASNWQKSREI